MFFFDWCTLSYFHYLLSTKINILKTWHSNAVRHRKISLVTRSERGIVKVAIKVFKKTCHRSLKSRGQHTWQQDLCPYLNAIKPNLVGRYNNFEYLGSCKQQLMPQCSCREFLTEGKSSKDQSRVSSSCRFTTKAQEWRWKGEFWLSFQLGVGDLGIKILNRWSLGKKKIFIFFPRVVLLTSVTSIQSFCKNF